jgi:signal transduction histidine kinase
VSLRLWSSLDGARDLRELRSRLLDNLLLLMALAATPGILISVLRARDIGWQTFMSVQIGILVVLWGLCLLRRRLGFGLRLGSFVVLSTVAALAATVQLGPAADARFFLVLATLVLGLLLSARAAWAFVGFSVLAVAALGVFAVQVGLPLRIDYPTYVRTPSAWFSITYTLAVYGGVIAYVAASLIRHLQHTAQLVERTSEVARIGTWELSAAGQLQWSALVRAIHGAEADPAGGIAGWLAHCDTAEARDRLGTAVAAAAQRGEPFSIELPASSRQGQALWLRITGLPDGRGGVQGLVQDITERRESERLKREFVAVVSHELRTPLTAISGSLDLIGSGALGEVPERMVPLIEVARRNGQRLRALIDDLLDVERLASGQLPLQLSPQRLREQLRLAVEVNAGYGAPCAWSPSRARRTPTSRCWSTRPACSRCWPT